MLQHDRSDHETGLQVGSLSCRPDRVIKPSPVFVLAAGPTQGPAAKQENRSLVLRLRT